MDGYPKVVLTADEMDEAISLITEGIIKNNSINDLVLVGIHTGGVPLAQRIRERIRSITGVEVPCGVLDITLYRDDWTRLSPQPIVKPTVLDFSIEDRAVVLVDDVIFTGRTTRAAMDAIMDFGRPVKLEMAVLVDRNHRELPISANYVGREVETTLDESVNVYLEEVAGRDEVLVEEKAPPQ